MNDRWFEELHRHTGRGSRRALDPTVRAVSASLCLCGFLLGGRMADAGDVEISRLQLRAEALVSGDTVRMADVLVLAGADQTLIDEIRAKPVAAKVDGQPTHTVTHDQIVKRLDELGVNLSRVLVSGPLTCRITRVSAAPSADAAAPTDAAPIVRAPRAGESGGEKTLAGAIQAYVDRELNALGGTAELAFERAGQEFLRLTAPPWDFDVSSTSRDKLGLREFRVVIRRDGAVQRKAEVAAHVRLVRPVVVARRPLNPGNLVRAEDLGTETRVFEQGASVGLGSVAEAVGQQIRQFVAAGDLVPADAIKHGDLVSRSRPVTVIGDSGRVQVRLSGVALDSGGYGETVRVRMGDARNQRKVVQGVVAGLGTVRLEEGATR